MPFYQVAELSRQLERDESLRLKPYRDSVGKLTIGIGRNLDDVGISEAEARVLLANDIQNAVDNLAKFLPWSEQLDQVRLGALVNACFNMGIGRAEPPSGLLGFRHALEAMQAGNYGAAANQFLDSEWSKQVGARAQRIAKQIESGEWT